MATPRQRAIGCNTWAMNRAPMIKRTTSKAILTWPMDGGRKRRVEVANAIRRLLPQYEFNSRRNWHEAPLTVENVRAAMEVWPEMGQTKGITEFLEGEQNYA